jgi:serine/threonine protein kinase
VPSPTATPIACTVFRRFESLPRSLSLKFLRYVQLPSPAEASTPSAYTAEAARKTSEVLPGGSETSAVSETSEVRRPLRPCLRVIPMWGRIRRRAGSEHGAIQWIEEMIGKTLGKYKLVEEIGRGGMAVIYKAYQESLDRHVAIKVLLMERASSDFAERFNREARAVARLSHPNILPIYDFGHEGDLSYIVMKYAPAGTLKGRMGKSMAPEEAVRFVSQIAAALDHAHERGVLHRDVKPGNVLLDEEDWVLLGDFGLAKLMAADVQLTASGVGVGTPAYMSPEQVQGLEVDARTDVYSLGTVLYEMVTGDVPFKADTPMAVALKHLTDPLPSPRSVKPGLPLEVEQIIVKAMAKDREDRYQSAGEMARTLLQALDEKLSLLPQAQRLPDRKPSPAPLDVGLKVSTQPALAVGAQLLVTSGQIAGQEFALAGEMRIGRRGDNDIILPDRQISGHHAHLSVSDGVILADVGSRNGTYVNGRRIREPYHLRDGDRIRMGRTELLFIKGQDTEAGRDSDVGVSSPRCPACGAHVPDSELFCPGCGRPLRGPERLK